MRDSGHWKGLSDHPSSSTQPTLPSGWLGPPGLLCSPVTHTEPSCCRRFSFIIFILLYFTILFYDHTCSQVLKWLEPKKCSPHCLSRFVHPAPGFSILSVYPSPLGCKGIFTSNSWNPYLGTALSYRMVQSVLYYDVRVKASCWTCPLDLPKVPEPRWNKPSLALKTWNSLLPTKHIVP